jgi:hypothetical protein
MKKLKETIKNIMKEESEYQTFFKKALEKSGKSISQMSDEEKKAFFNKIDTAWDGKGEKNEELVGNQHKLDVDGDGEIEASDLAALRAGKKNEELVGKQHKLDVDNDGEIEASDLAALRAGKKKEESVNEVDDADKVWVVTKNKGQAYQISKKAYNANKDRYILGGNRAQANTYAKQIRDKMKSESANENFSPSDIQKIKEGPSGPPLAIKWRDNAKKGYNLKVGNIRLQSAGPDNLHSIYKNNSLWGKFELDYEADFNDWHVQPINGKDFYVDSIDAIVKAVKEETKFMESVNENFSPSDIEKIKGAVEKASSFMGIGKELKSIGMKYDFMTSPYPVYMIKKGSKTYVLINKKYAEDPEFVIGDTAGGLLEGKVNESQFKVGDKLKHKKASVGTFVVLDTKNGLKVKNLNTGKVTNDLINPENFELVKESQFKSGDKVIISHPVMIKPIKGVVSTVLNARGEEVLVLKGNHGVWDAKFAKLDEGNAFGAAVTKAKKEGLKEFEFNGKKYKVKKGSYEKNESAKKLAEKSEAVTKK